MSRVLVVGLAETGVAVTRRLRAEGDDVVVVEDAPGAAKNYVERVSTVRALGADLEEAPDRARVDELVAAADLVVPSPLVRPLHPLILAALSAGIPVRSEIDLAGERAEMPIVAVTGTNGKTTVTTLTAAMLEASGVRAIAAGNIGRPLIDAIGDDVGVVVAEVSSFQLAFVDTFRPRVAVILAITPDHLDWHGSFDHYAASKARITQRQRDDDVLVFDADDSRATNIARTAHCRIAGVSIRSAASGCAHVADDGLVLADGTMVAPVTGMRRALPHDRTNALAASVAALAVGATLAGIRGALAGYATMPHRVALVGEANGVSWYDDSKATNPDAALHAVGSFDSVVLLAGGRNKGLDLSILGSAAPRLRAVVGFGEAGPEIAAAFGGIAGPEVVTVTTMHDAVAAARRFAQPGDAVVLSPACASFDAYAGYGQRGDDFAAEVRAQALREQAS